MVEACLAVGLVQPREWLFHVIRKTFLTSWNWKIDTINPDLRQAILGKLYP